VPFVSKAIGVPLAKIGAKVMAGATLEELGFTREIVPEHVAVKESVFPFNKFPGVDTILSPEMRSTGEVMGIAEGVSEAFRKALLASGVRLPAGGRVFISVRDADKAAACELGRQLVELGFEIVATEGTQQALGRSEVRATRVRKATEGTPNVVDSLREGEIAMVINTTEGAQAIRDSRSLRRQTLLSGIPYFTTLPAASAAVTAIATSRGATIGVLSLQEYHSATIGA
jgi:carbamoyl-phosphate synthase large subunit